MHDGTAVQPFTFPATGQAVRTVLVDGEPWFVAKDCCEAIGISKYRDAVAHLDVDERASAVVDTLGGPQTVSIVSEAGLYSLLMISRSPKIQTFRRWVTHEVLPAIRRTGSYSVAELGRKELARMVIAAEEEREKLAAQVAELEPDAARARQTLDADGLALVGTVAKRFGIKERSLRQFLWGEGLLIRDGSRRNEPMARYVASGHFELKTTMVTLDPDRPQQSRSTTYVTPKGEALVWRRLHAAGMVASPYPPARQLELL